MEDLRLERRGRLRLAAVAGELANEKVQAARRGLERALEDPGCAVLVLDLSAASFLDSSGIGLLVSLAARAKAAGCRFCLLDPSPQARKTLELVRLLAYFEVLAGRQELAGLEG
jgi:anti-sigma B factor antagonist